MSAGIADNIGYRQWGASPSKAVLLLVHGLGAHAGRWEAAGDFFSKNGISSYAVELKGINSPDDRSYSFRDLYAKILRLHDTVRKEHPDKSIFLVGESMGGLISFMLSIEHPGLFNGFVAISPAFSNMYKPSFSDLLGILVPLLYNPKKEFNLPFNSSLCTRDVNYRKKLDEDPKEYRSAPSKLIFDMLMAQFYAKVLRRRLKVPVLFLLAGEDKIVDLRSSRTVFKDLKIKDKTLVEFPGMYHSLSIELGKENVFKEILKWVEERIKK